MSTELAKQSGLPSYLQAYQQENVGKPIGTENLTQYFVPPRLKIKQAQSGDNYKDYQNGDVLLTPELSLIAHSGEKFWITPIFQFTEFCKWSPYGLKGTMPVIAERSVDLNSVIAKRAKSKKEEDWYEICPDAKKNLQGDRNYQYRYCEHINFIVVLRPNLTKADHPANRHVNNPFIMSFHHSGFYEGKQFSTLMVNRRIPIFAGQYEFKTVDKSNAKGNWKGFSVTNPSMESGMIPCVENEADFLNYKGMYEKFQDMFREDAIRADYDDDSTDSEPVEDAAGKF